MKGAPEIIFSRCSTIQFHGRNQRINDQVKSQFEAACTRLAGSGERVLAFADLELPRDRFPKNFEFDDSIDNNNKANFPLNGLRFIGLASMVDPPRAMVPEAVARCRSAGIRVNFLFLKTKNFINWFFR